MPTKEKYNGAANVTELEPLPAKVETRGLSQYGQNLAKTDAMMQNESLAFTFLDCHLQIKLMKRNLKMLLLC